MKAAGCTRRDFLQAAGAAALTLGLTNLRFADSALASSPQTQTMAELPQYRAWEDLYREKWRWDRLVRGTHTMTNCVSACAWDLYVKDDVVWREEQRSPYGSSGTDLPDFNPRGCQKGACAAWLMYSPSRVRYPMRRVGPRGSGRWRRISWEEALEEIATATVDAIASDGPASILCELGPNIGAGPNSAAPLRFFRLLGAPLTDSMAQIGDLSTGATITLGNGHPCGSSDDWFRSAYLVLWAFNPAATRIPDAHFINEARYRGARVVVVAPDYNNTAIHADLWLNPRPGTDAALALAAAQTILEENLFDAAYVAEQTDLPLLLRTDNNRFLRESDVRPGGREDTFFVWNEKDESLAIAPGGGGSATLALGDVQPALFARPEVKLADGQTVRLRTVLSLLRERLDRENTPEKAAAVTGIAATTIRRFAREFAKAPAALILSQWGSCKFLHADLMQRSQLLLASLTGNLGRAGGGWRAGGFFAPEGFVLLAFQERLDLLRLGAFALSAYWKPEEVERQFASCFVPGSIWHHVHGGLAHIAGDRRYGDTSAAGDPRAHLQTAIDKGWFPVHPKPGKTPRVVLSIFGNVLRHCRNNTRLLENLWPKLGLVVDVNFRVSETGRWADIILPAAHWYEKADLKYLVSFVPYVHLGDRAVPPLGEAKPEWEIFASLAAAVARRAQERSLAPYADIAGVQRDAGRLHEAFTDGGRFGALDEEKALEFIVGYSSQTKNLSLADLRHAGATRFTALGPPGGTAGFFSDYTVNEPLVPQRWFVQGKQRWPTLTGRQQYYIDHPWFLEWGEALPVHKPPPAAGGDYPLVLSGGHTRWSIHSQWRDQQTMLRLQRGEPVVYISGADAAARGIGDHDRVRVFNDLGAFVVRAKISPSARPGQLLLYHAWEPYQFDGHRSDHSITPSPFKPTSLVGDYGHLHWAYAHWEPNQIDRDTRVDVKRIG
jgi:DMSO reductase family type II enzyme molybdopterin subunit